MARRSDIDWDAIEREYRLGQKSNKQLATEHGVQPSSIGRRAERHGWIQDKAGEVRSRAANILVQAAAADVPGNATPNANSNATPTEQQIKVAARVAADVVLGHRRGLTKLSRLRDSMLDEIEAQTVAIDMLARIVEVTREPDQNGIDKRNDLLQRVISLPSRVESLKKLTEVDEKIRRGEREAFGITADEGASIEKARVVWMPKKDAD
ncbi:hypothetical protein QTH87_00410 [Variovorax sp. J22P168]|uniref:hypothetical protein n=1 Tax=Variovorax jilinensis TaxID=3053513 RepID=UPI002578DF61|nr:hypothetical protein [Variovorax sp. J22P168]MDM0010886.1 hypothetical protein [Variovorax sp. J22P168]